MKKVVSFIIAVSLLCILIPSAVSAEEIEGLEEKLNELLLEESVSEQQITEMDEAYKAYYSERLLAEYLPGKQALNRLETDSLEEEYELEMSRAKLNYANSVKVSLLSTTSYLKQYADNGSFQYLFSGKEYWSVPGYDIYSDKARFSLEGEPIANVEEYFGVNYYGIIIPDEAVMLIKDKERLQAMLLEVGETKVDSIKIFAYSQPLAMMYIEGGKTEYLIKLWDATGSGKQYIPDIEEYKLYTAIEAIESLSKDRPDTVGKTKNIFEAEATSLAAEGLLYGNENGLDLLKPLTRIEAATMLLRAMGESETPQPGSVQIFADVPAEHWGYGAAENAYRLGLIKGVGEDRFAPDEQVTGPEFSTMVLRAAGQEEFDWQNALNLLVEQGILSAENISTMDFFTRGDMAKIIYEARVKGLI